MGFFDFLQKKSQAPETVSFSQLGPWLQQYVEKKNLGEKLQGYTQKFEEIQKQLKTALESLQNSALPSISEEEVRIVQENKEHYLEKVHFFLDNLHPPQDVSDLGYFTSKISQDHNELIHSLEQNQYVLEQYLPKALAPVVNTLKTLSEHNGAFLTQLRSEHLEDVREIQTQLDEYKKDAEKRQKLQQQKQHHEEELAPLKQREEKILRRLAEYKKTTAYEDYQALLRQKQPLMNELQKEKQDLQQPFLHLSPVLHKYRYETNPLVHAYLEDAAQALLEDTRLTILTVLHELQEQLHGLDLKEDKEVQALNTLPSLTTEYFNEKRTELHELGEQLNQINAQLANNIMSLNIMEQESLLTETKNRMQDIQETLQMLNQKLEDLHEENYKNKIKELLFNLGDLVLQDE